MFMCADSSSFMSLDTCIYTKDDYPLIIADRLMQDCMHEASVYTQLSLIHSEPAFYLDIIVLDKDTLDSLEGLLIAT